MRTVTEPQRQIPVRAEVDVVVCGGGPAGFVAAVAAGRQGARVMLVERYGHLGGMASTGLPWGRFTDGEKVIFGGIAMEVIDRLREMNAITVSDERLNTFNPFDWEKVTLLAARMAAESGVRLMLHTWVADALVEADRVHGVVTESKSGRSAILAQTVVDATGDGDVACRAGAPYEKGDERDGSLQSATLLFVLGGVDVRQFEQFKAQQSHNKGIIRNPSWTRLVEAEQIELPENLSAEFWPAATFPVPERPGEVIFNWLQLLPETDGTSVEDLTRGEVEARESIYRFVDILREHVPGCEEAYVTTVSRQIGVRETRRIRGDRTLDREHVLEQRVPPDSICLNNYIVDIHPSKQAFGRDTVSVHLPSGKYYGVPYGCLLPRGLEGLLVAGRCISADRWGQGSARIMPCCMATGQAAGVAAALSARANVTPRQLGAAPVRAELMADGVPLEPWC